MWVCALFWSITVDSTHSKRKGDGEIEKGTGRERACLPSIWHSLAQRALNTRLQNFRHNIANDNYKLKLLLHLLVLIHTHTNTPTHTQPPPPTMCVCACVCLFFNFSWQHQSINIKFFSGLHKSSQRVGGIKSKRDRKSTHIIQMHNKYVCTCVCIYSSI